MPHDRRNLLATGAPPRCQPLFRIAAGAGSVELVAAAASESGSPAKLPTIKMTAYNGGAMDVGWGLPVVIDLKGVDIAGHARPILKDHDPSQVVGHTTKIAKADGKSLVIDAVVSGTGDAAREVVANSANGFPWQASVGVHARNYEYVKEGSNAKANGQEFSGPLYIVRKGILAESSVVAMGADNTTSTSIAARLNHQGETDMKFDKWLEAKGFDAATITDGQRSTLQAAYDAETKVTAAAPAPSPEAPTAGTTDVVANIADYRKAQAAESARIAAIRVACAGKHGAIEAQAIADGWDESKTELAVLRAERAAAPAGHVRGNADPAKRAKSIVAALAMAAGVPEAAVAKDRGFDAPVMEAALSREFRNISLHAMMHDCIAASGGYAPRGRVDNEFIRCALDADRKIQASGFSGAALTNILGAVGNKVALNQFESIEMVGTQFCQVYDATNFQTFTMVRLMENGAFAEVGPGGELKHGDLSEDAYTNKVKTRGMMLTLTRQDIFNDDLGKFNQMVGMLGRNAAIALESHVFTVLMANAGTHFGTGNKNYISGAATVLGIDGFTSAEQKMLDMVDSSGKPILLSPKNLVVPTSLKVTAQLLMSQILINESTSTDKGKPAANPHAGKCKVLASPYINNSSITNNSSTAWFIFADPNAAPCQQIAFLNGQRTPTIETGEADFNTLGMSWRGYFDFGSKLIDPRGAVMSKGAA